jgi:hypothetical protein
LADFLLDFPAYLFALAFGFQIGIVRPLSYLLLNLVLHSVSLARASFGQEMPLQRILPESFASRVSTIRSTSRIISPPRSRRVRKSIHDFSSHWKPHTAFSNKQEKWWIGGAQFALLTYRGHPRLFPMIHARHRHTWGWRLVCASRPKRNPRLIPSRPTELATPA